jgi:hypothetical protein
MSDPSAFLRLIEESSRDMSEADRRALAHRHMLALADLLIGWSLDTQFDADQIRKLLGWADHWERAADEVGPAWNPPEPEHLTLLQLIARIALRELHTKPSGTRP